MVDISFSGIASGIDSDAIIKATIEAKRTAYIPTENRKLQAEQENEAFEEFNTLLLGLRGTLEGFLSLEGSAVSKLASSSKPDAIDVTAGQNAQQGSVSVRVDQLASAGTLSFANRFSTPTEPIAPALVGEETISLQVGTETIDLVVDAGTSLNDIVDQISNAGEGFVSAGLINGGSESNPEYLLMINSTKTGVQEGEVAVNVPSSLQGILGDQIVDQAKDASLFVTGVGQISRSSNTITDVVPGVTLELKDVTTASAQITVRNDASVTATKIEEFVNAYNQVLSFSKDNSSIESVETEDGLRNEFGILSRTRVDEQALQGIRSGISSSKSSIEGSSVAILADLGITTDRDGLLSFDKDIFNEALGRDPASADSVLRSFADKVASTSGVISDYTKFGGLLELARDSNLSRISSIDDRLRRLEANLQREEENLRLLYARLEGNIGELNSQSSQLLSLLQF